MRKQLIVCAFCFGFINWSLSQTNTKVSLTTKKYIDSLMLSRLQKNKVVGTSIAIVDNGQIVYSQGYGFSDKESKQLATDSTIYRIGSCSKAFTALSIMQLKDKRLLKLDESIKKYLPEFTMSSHFNDNNNFYINDILAHTSGLPGDVMNGFFCDSPPSINWLINQLNYHTTAAPRLKIRAYSNIGYGLLGEVIARLSKSSYPGYLREAIFNPLGMRMSYVEDDPILNRYFSKAYYEKKKIKEPLIRDQAAGLIHSNVLDMAIFLKCLINGGKVNNTQIVSSETILEMMKNQTSNTLLSKEDDWGFGLYASQALIKSKTNPSDTLVIRFSEHGGDTYAFHADFCFNQELGIGAVILTNTDNGANIADSKALVKWYLEKEKDKKVKLRYKVKKDGSAISFPIAKANELPGIYPVANILIKVSNPESISFKQGPLKVKLYKKEKNDSIYLAKAKLFGLISIKMKDVGFAFETIENQIHLKQLNTQTQRGTYIATKTDFPVVTKDWKDRLGKYKVLEPYFKCEKCVLADPTGLTLKLTLENEILKVETKGNSPYGSDVYLLPISNMQAVTTGIGRGTGETLYMLPNGNLSFMGFEFQMKK
jgi:CubicO group peptidase (beta-lactamase class C family)